MPTSGPIDADTGHDELVTGVSPWGNHIHRPPLARLDSSFKTDVVVVGAGITGAFAAWFAADMAHRLAPMVDGWMG